VTVSLSALPFPFIGTLRQGAGRTDRDTGATESQSASMCVRPKAGRPLCARPRCGEASVPATRTSWQTRTQRPQRMQKVVIAVEERVFLLHPQARDRIRIFQLLNTHVVHHLTHITAGSFGQLRHPPVTPTLRIEPMKSWHSSCWSHIRQPDGCSLRMSCRISARSRCSWSELVRLPSRSPTGVVQAVGNPLSPVHLHDAHPATAKRFNIRMRTQRRNIDNLYCCCHLSESSGRPRREIRWPSRVIFSFAASVASAVLLAVG